MTIAELSDALLAAGVPIVNVTMRGSTPTINYAPGATPAQVAQGNAILAAANFGLRRPRPLMDIYAQFVATTPAQQDAVIADLQVARDPPAAAKWTQLRPPQDAAAVVAWWAATRLAGATPSEKRQAGGLIAAMWCQQHPDYLTKAPFAFNIPGDEPDPA